MKCVYCEYPVVYLVRTKTLQVSLCPHCSGKVAVAHDEQASEDARCILDQLGGMEIAFEHFVTTLPDEL